MDIAELLELLSKAYPSEKARLILNTDGSGYIEMEYNGPYFIFTDTQSLATYLENEVEGQ